MEAFSILSNSMDYGNSVLRAVLQNKELLQKGNEREITVVSARWEGEGLCKAKHCGVMLHFTHIPDVEHLLQVNFSWIFTPFPLSNG